MHLKNSMVSDSPDTGSQAPGRSHSARSWIMITQAFLISLIALFGPLPVFGIDILIAANLALTAIMLFLIFFATEPARITFIPVWVAGLSLLRLGTGIAAVRSLLLNADAGKLVGLVSERIYHGQLSMIIALILIPALCIFICAAAFFIYKKASNYLSKIIPARSAALEAEYAQQTVTHVQMLRAATRINKQTLFFSRVSQTSGLLVTEAVMMAVVFEALLVFSILKPGAAAPAAAAAIAAVTYVCGFLLAISMAILLNKRFLINLKVGTAGKNIFAPVNKDAATAQGPESAAQTSESADQENSPAEINEQSAAFKADSQRGFLFEEQIEVSAETTADTDAPVIRDDYYYDSILATIGDRKRATILLAAQTAADLPVTVAVELAIRIIGMKKRCLLIDTDTARNTVSAAFDIDINSMQGKAIPTGIDKLWICPAGQADDTASLSLSRKVANALKVFHYIVIFAPNAGPEEIQEQLAGIADVAVIFGNEKSPALKAFTDALSASGCRVIPEREFAADDLPNKNA